MPLKCGVMRICRFDDNRVGIVSGEGIRDVTSVLDGLPQVTYPLPRHDPFIAAPVNYKKHLEEALADKGIHHGNLVSEIHKAGMFLKAPSSRPAASPATASAST